ncbi:baseplate J/gp47 family protein [Paenibacillus sp. S28]|uniref:baseplate J/gp47 family protein n=1 Tax=Paenibacillus sp. S28 TaxID=2767463 RepID=UPI00190991EB|nr:baseplate J/gp47 family protein [Paenibacillus sp. S28]MBJ9991457.1 baseplate J/gp47 family protein [Paenibacillus sp. S28]
MVDLPLFLQDQTEENIMSRMLARVPSDIDKSEGSFIWDAQAPVAFMLSEAALWSQEVLRRGFASTAFGEYLTLRTAERGVNRRAAVPATGIVKFVGQPGKKLAKGTLIGTPADEITGESSIEYQTTADVTLDSNGEGLAPITALVAGSQGNVPAGVIEVMLVPTSGIISVTNPAAVTGGADEESDESLLERYYAEIRNQGTSGNKAQYIQWANEVPGVGGVQVAPLWQGPGTVGIYLVDMDKRAASPAIVEAVQQYIDPTMDGQGEGKAPAGPVVTVMPAKEVPIDISVQLTLADGATLDMVKEQMIGGITAYLKQLAFADPLVRFTRIAAILLDIPPIIDYSNLTVNGAADTNIQISPGEVAVLGVVDVHE